MVPLHIRLVAYDIRDLKTRIKIIESEINTRKEFLYLYRNDLISKEEALELFCLLD